MNNNTEGHHKVITTALFMCLLGAIFYCYEYYLRVVPSVIRPELKLAYNIGETGFGFLAALYYWAYVPLQLPAGIIIDYLGPRKVLTMACLICAIGTYLFAGTDILLIAQIGRFLVGFGSAFAYIGVLKLANIWLPKRWFAFMAGFCSTLGMLGAMSGQIVIATYSITTGWKVTLYYSAFVGIIFTIILGLFVKDYNKLVEKEYIGDRLKRHSLLWKELLEVIRLPDLWLNGLIGCLMFAALSVFAEMWAVSFLETIGIREESATFCSSMVFFGFGVGAPIWGILSDIVVSRKLPLMIGSIISAILIFLILYLPMSVWLINICMFLFGLFVSAEVLIFPAINDLCHKDISGTAVGFVNMLVMIGGLLLQPIVGILLDYLTDYTEVTRFKVALAVLPIGLVCSAVLSIFLKDSIKNSND